ncbi:hypothetical protein AWH63_10275 [Marinobacter sp. C18]|uniref:hypothetical protein n=1 Tax=Marinobacter sp. C18 TaxID=1772288 RepID=UPI0009491BFE|nr:hypothetical protein [Marinobacter sp. C18]OLF81919.1 hypothetical protein AWH63_10275 [Marinobacter sp. C18]
MPLTTSPRLKASLLATALTLGLGSATGFSSLAVAAQSAADPKVAIRAVQATLPSVAILGQKEGPAGTTEVFIQVPGVLNMQSVYVLQDGKTVISGVVVPPIENGFPGAQLSLPNGQASVDPRAPRADVNEINDVLGMGDAQQTRTHKLKGNDTIHKAQQKELSYEVPKLPKEEAARDIASVTSGTVQRLPEPSEPAPAPEVAVEENGSGTAPAPTNTGLQEQNGEILIESLDDVAESGSFSRVVGAMLERDRDIEAIRNLTEKEAQQQGYLDLVQSRPAIVQGKANKRVYAIFDPNCPVCHRYYDEVSALTNSGQLEVHWIPAIVFPDERSSLTASAALLAETQRQGGDPLGMLDKVMTQEGFTSKIDSAPNVDRLVPYLDGVVKNTAVMAMARAETPLLVFENVEGELTISPGIPSTGYESIIKSDS